MARTYFRHVSGDSKGVSINNLLLDYHLRMAYIFSISQKDR